MTLSESPGINKPTLKTNASLPRGVLIPGRHALGHALAIWVAMAFGTLALVLTLWMFRHDPKDAVPYFLDPDLSPRPPILPSCMQYIMLLYIH